MKRRTSNAEHSVFDVHLLDLKKEYHMETLVIITCGFYFLSTAGYLFYLIFQKDFLQRAGFGLLLAGFAAHTVVLAT